jgi:TonB family protein
MKTLLFCGMIMLVALRGAYAQTGDPLDNARALYVSASYEDALAELSKVPPGTPAGRVEQYRAFCLIALGRAGEASTAVAKAVSADPLLVPSPSDASPRVRALFAETRRKMLPDIAREAYSQGKAAYAAKDLSAAGVAFQHVIDLEDAMSSGGDDRSDLRLLAQEFLELSLRVSTPAAAAVPPGAGPTTSVAAVPASLETVEPLTVGRSVAAIRETMPVWTRPTPGFTLMGQLHITIDERGDVTSATITRPSDPDYDRDLVVAAKQWKYEPATRDGRALPSEKTITFTLRR